MPRKYRRRYVGKKKRKWRQQKLAVGTVARIAKKVASKLDRKQDARQIRYLSEVYAADGYSWPDSQVINNPPQTAYRPVLSGALESKLVSKVSELLTDPAAVNLSPADADAITCYCKGIQMRFALQNRNSISCRVNMAIVFIPNLNRQTEDAVDFLRPDQYMLYRFGSGIQYEGWDKKQIRNLAGSPSSVRKFVVLAHKKVTLPGTVNSGFTVDNQQQRITTRYYNLTKHFKGMGKKHNIKPGTSEDITFSDGSYYYMLWSDLPAGDDLHYLGCSSMKLLPGSTTFSINVGS